MDTTKKNASKRLSYNGDPLLEIKAHQAYQRHLLVENVKLRSNIEGNQFRNAPMRALIPELCILIFAFAVKRHCSDGSASDLELSPAPSCSPLALAHVCQRWRAIVLDSPRLWADLHIKFSSPRLTLIHFWFQNARAVPIAVTICASVATAPGWIANNPARNVNLAVVKDLVPYLHRIQSLALHVHQTALPLLFPRGTVSNMLLLERLYIRHHGYILDEYKYGKINAPKLQSLQLCDPSPFVNTLSDSLSNLKTLRVDKVEFWEYPRKVPDLLSSCANLEDVTMTFPSNLYLAGPEPVSLPSVFRLSFEWQFPCNPIPIFSSIQAPQLRHLSLTHYNFLATFSSEAVSALQDLIRSSPCLATLTLVGCNLISLCKLSSIFYYAPALEELILLNCCGTGRLLYDLSPADWEGPDTWLCPRLERIRLAGIRDDEVRALINFVRRRMRPPNPCEDATAYHLKELRLDSRIRDFMTIGRLLILRGLCIITPSVKVAGPLDHIELVLFRAPVPLN